MWLWRTSNHSKRFKKAVWDDLSLVTWRSPGVRRWVHLLRVPQCVKKISPTPLHHHHQPEAQFHVVVFFFYTRFSPYYLIVVGEIRDITPGITFPIVCYPILLSPCDALLYSLVVMNGYFSYCCCPISSCLTFGINEVFSSRITLVFSLFPENSNTFAVSGIEISVRSSPSVTNNHATFKSLT